MGPPTSLRQRVSPDMSGVRVYFNNEVKAAGGWGPVAHMVRMATNLLEAEFHDTSDFRASKWDHHKMALRRPKKGPPKTGISILVAQGPPNIYRFTALPEFRDPRHLRALWIIDSFRTEDLPNQRIMKHFDVIAYSQSYDRPFYEKEYGDRALHLGWGTDALDLGSDRPDRSFDLLRVGRQPSEWDDDTRTLQATTTAGLRFQGRPPPAEIPDQWQKEMMGRWYSQSKYVVAHSNLVDDANYTHQDKEYITGRWTDSIGAGAVVVGRQPRTDLQLLTWPEAVLDFDRVDLKHNVEAIAEACQTWTPDIAKANFIGALKHLDWRWRIHRLAERLGLTTASLNQEMARLHARIAQAADH